MKAIKSTITKKSAQAAVMALFGIVGSHANGALSLIAPGFPADAVITFEAPTTLNTVNPSYIVGGNTVSFGAAFTGQTVSLDPAGSPTHWTVTGSPTAAFTFISPTFPLSGGTVPTKLDSAVVNDPAHPPGGSNQVLAGLADLDNVGFPFPTAGGTTDLLYNSPIAVLFATPVARVQFDAALFNTLGSSSVTAYASDGSVLGTYDNTVFGDGLAGKQTFAFMDSGADIKALSIYIKAGAFDAQGFSIDNLAFTTIIPETGNVASLGLLIGTGLMLRKRRTKA